MRILRKNIILLLIIAAGLSACNISNHLSKNQYLLTKNKVDITEKKARLELDEINSLIEQHPNQSLFGIARVKMWLYMWTDHPDRSKFASWINKTLGEKPVIFDTRLAETSETQISSYLNNIGYFNNIVSFNKRLNKRQNKVDIDYIIDLSTPYSIRKISYLIPDPEIKYLILKNNSYSLLDTGQVYNAYTFEEERNRLANILKNEGYYAFNKEYVYFEVDTTIGHNQLDVTVNISNRQMQGSVPDEVTEAAHKRFLINDIYINTDYNPLAAQERKSDTLLVNLPRDDDRNKFLPYYFIYRDQFRIKPQAITQSIFLEPGQLFVLQDVQKSYKRLNNIRLFKYANIQFHEIERNSTDTSKFDYLDCNIQLSRAKLQSYTIEAEGTNTGGDLGIGFNLVYQNKNIFRGAEILSVRTKFAMEVQRLSSVEKETDDKTFLFFNTMETGGEISLYFPRFLIPVRHTTFSKYFKPKTTLTTGINYQRRPKYERYITNLSFGYDWSASEFKEHIFLPFDISLVKVFPTPAFDTILDNLKDERLKNQFTDHLIMAMSYSYVFNNQDINKLKNFTYFRGNIETAGNMLNAMDQVIQAPRNEEGYYTLLNIRYAQYIRTDLDFRYYFILNENNTIATRAIFGVGIPYGNSDALPFEKGFYGGGANGMRAWEFRSLGPGAYVSDDANFDRMGDMKIEANIEYRFPIYKFFKSALFVDAGNVWLLNDNQSFPEGNFKFNSFLSEIAMDAGLGLRFDFGFFIFRIDGAVPLRNPALPKGDRWSFNEISFRRINWNFGIGYPF